MRDNQGGGVGIFTVLTIVFIVLKMTGNIDWSWWWVFAPIWIPMSIVVIAATVMALCLRIRS